MNKTDTIMRINTLSQLPPYQEEDLLAVDCGTWSECRVVCEWEQYGVIGGDGSTLLPLEYDNISIVGFGVLLLVKQGKMGMAFLNREAKEEPFFIKRLIPCEYDYVQTGNPPAGGHLLHTISESGDAIRVYMSVADVLTDEYDYTDRVASPIGTFFALKREKHVDILDEATGKLVFSDEECIYLGGYATAQGVLFQATGDNNETKLIHIGADGEPSINTYCLHGGSNVIAIPNPNIDEGRMVTFASFIVETDDGYAVVDATGDSYSGKVYPLIRLTQYARASWKPDSEDEEDADWFLYTRHDLPPLDDGYEQRDV